MGNGRGWTWRALPGLVSLLFGPFENKKARTKYRNELTRWTRDGWACLVGWVMPHFRLQSFLDGFHYVRGWIVSRLVYCSIRFHATENISVSDVEKRTLSGRTHERRNLDKATDLDTL